MKKLSTFSLPLALALTSGSALAAPLTLTFVSTGTGYASGTMSLPDDTLITTGSYSFTFNSYDPKPWPAQPWPTGTGYFQYPIRGWDGYFTGEFGIATASLWGTHQWVQLTYSDGFAYGGFQAADANTDGAWMFNWGNAFSFNTGGAGENFFWSSTVYPYPGLTLSGYWTVAEVPLPSSLSIFLIGLAALRSRGRRLK